MHVLTWQEGDNVEDRFIYAIKIATEQGYCETGDRVALACTRLCGVKPHSSFVVARC